MSKLGYQVGDQLPFFVTQITKSITKFWYMIDFYFIFLIFTYLYLFQNIKKTQIWH